jgi:putative colanic acid biosynthesis acetyltransferase WcaB
MIKYLFQDWKANKYSIKGRIIMFLFRMFSSLNSPKYLRIILFPLIFLYRVFVEWMIGIEINLNAKVGRNFIIFHGQSTVVNGTTVIGENCLIRNSVTIGSKMLADGTNTKAATIGNNVEIGSNSVIIGDISIGDNVIIGAGSVVVKSFPDNCIVAGNPAKIIRHIKA